MRHSPKVSIHCIDTLFRSRKNYASIYALLWPNGEAALFDTGTPAHYPELRAKLNAIGVNKENLTRIFVSHVHMDHSGNSFLLARDFPKATLYAHPNSVPHLCDPSVLVQQTKAIMKSTFAPEYGDHIQGIPRERIIATRDNAELDGRLQILHTEGHATHHISLFESETKTVFTGDSFGSVYPQINPRKAFVSTSPATFDAEKMIESIDKMMALGISRVGLAHFGFVEDVEGHYKACLKWLNDMKGIARDGMDVKERVRECFKNLYGDDYEKHYDHLKMDVLVNGLGVAVYAKHLRKRNIKC